MKTIDFWCLTGGLRGYQEGIKAIDLRYFEVQDGWQKRAARHQADGA